MHKKYKVGKPFTLEITRRRSDFHLLEDQIAAAAALDGILVIRTCVLSEARAHRNTISERHAGAARNGIQNVIYVTPVVSIGDISPPNLHA